MFNLCITLIHASSLWRPESCRIDNSLNSLLLLIQNKTNKQRKPPTPYKMCSPELLTLFQIHVMVGWGNLCLLPCLSCSVIMCVELVFPVQHCDFSLTGHEGVCLQRLREWWRHRDVVTSQAACCGTSTVTQLGADCWLPTYCGSAPPPQSLLAIEYVLLQLTFCHPLVLFSRTISQPWLTKIERALRIDSSALIFYWTTKLNV